MALIFFERKDMMLENVLDTQNMVVGRQKNFIRRLEVGFHSLKEVFRSHGDHEIWFRKIKNLFFLLFLSFLGIDASLYPNFLECKRMMLDNVLGNQNIVLGRQGNFLWWFEVELHSLNFSEPDFMVAMGSEKQL